MAARRAPRAAAPGLLAALVALAACPASHGEHAPEARALGCEAPCGPAGPEDSSGNCRTRVLWLSEHSFAEQPQPCLLAFQQVLDECPECSHCSPAETRCFSAGEENVPAPEWAAEAAKALSAAGAGGRGQSPAAILNESLAQQFDKTHAIEGPAADLAVPGLQHLAAICSTLLAVGLSCRACAWSGHVVRVGASSSTGASVPGAAGERRGYSYAPVPRSDPAAR
ncbi:unnamed protein product [Prorocentrum cordatum]|uniref:Uncharacterized protein n=1 Tax=Prorocentrum cordatum TaxID=2364126 RepID=A0ABN9Y6M3_9DINO|nr:unnamed protein product [Polarella glacialis]